VSTVDTMTRVPDLLPGTLDLLILCTLQGRRAKYYRLTASGRRQLAIEAREWERMAHAIGRVMKLA
jgi:hypothetical protein